MTYSKFRLGTPEDLVKTNKAVKEHLALKAQVAEALKEFEEEAEGVVFERIEGELEQVWNKVTEKGRLTFIGSGVFSIGLAFCCPWVSAVVGLGGFGIGYAITDSYVYACKVSEARYVSGMKEIVERVRERIDEYQQSQAKIVLELDTYDISQGNDFKENFRRIRSMIENAEDKLEEGQLSDLDAFVSNAKHVFYQLPEDKREMLDSESFKLDLSGLFKPGLVASAARELFELSNIPTGVGNAIADGIQVVGANVGFFAHLFQGINVAINGFTLARDYREYCKLKRMRDSWKTDKNEAKEDERFVDGFKLKDEIREIRDKLLENPY